MIFDPRKFNFKLLDDYRIQDIVSVYEHHNHTLS